MSSWKVYSDARASGEIAIVILKDEKEVHSETNHVDCHAIHDGEYKALLRGYDILTTLIPLKRGDSITFVSDSEFMIKQIQGDYKVKNDDLKPLYADVISNIQLLHNSGMQVKVAWEKRDNNLAGHILEGKRKAGGGTVHTEPLPQRELVDKDILKSVTPSQIPEIASLAVIDSITIPKKNSFKVLLDSMEGIDEGIKEGLAVVMEAVARSARRDVLSEDYNWWEARCAISILSIVGNSEGTFTLQQLQDQMEYCRRYPDMLQSFKAKIIKDNFEDKLKSN